MIPEQAISEKKQADKENSVDRRKISDASRTKVEDAIAQVDDPDAQAALEEMWAVIAGRSE